MATQYIRAAIDRRCRQHADEALWIAANYETVWGRERVKRGWTCAMVAEKVGISGGFYWYLERNEKRGKPHIRRRINRLYGLPEDG